MANKPEDEETVSSSSSGASRSEPKSDSQLDEKELER